jgi:signal transduction histidine kinase
VTGTEPQPPDAVALLAVDLAAATDEQSAIDRALTAVVQNSPTAHARFVGADEPLPADRADTAEQVAVVAGDHRYGTLLVDGDTTEYTRVPGIAAVLAATLGRLAADPGATPPEQVRNGTPELSCTTSGHSLEIIMRSAMRGTRSDFVLVSVRTDHQRLLVEAGLGPLAGDMVGSIMPLTGTVSAEVFETGEPQLLADFSLYDRAPVTMRGRVRSMLVAPMQGDPEVEGLLVVGRLLHRPPHTEADLADLTAFVKRTGTARELRRVREDRRTARLSEDRIRISADLHDNVIQQLFASGMALQSVADRIDDPQQRDRILEQVDALDATTRRIRSLISMGDNSEAPELPLSKRLVAIVDSLTPALRCLPTVTIVGSLEPAVDDELAEDLEAVLREALSNVARHAYAGVVQVQIEIDHERLRLDVIDDGRGVGSPPHTSGIANMRLRAARHHGELVFSSPADGGTHLSWRVSTAPVDRRGARSFAY